MPAVCRSWQSGWILDFSAKSVGQHTQAQAAYSEGHRRAVGGDKSGRVSSESSKVSILVERPVCLCPSRSSLAAAHRS